jgi:hypothetical protein
MSDYTPQEIKDDLQTLSVADLDGTFSEAIRYLTEKQLDLRVAFPKYSDFLLNYDYHGYEDERVLNIVGVRLETPEEVAGRKHNEAVQAEFEIRSLKAQKVLIEEKLRKLNQ